MCSGKTSRYSVDAFIVLIKYPVIYKIGSGIEIWNAFFYVRVTKSFHCCSY